MKSIWLGLRYVPKKLAGNKGKPRGRGVSQANGLAILRVFCQEQADSSVMLSKLVGFGIDSSTEFSLDGTIFCVVDGIYEVRVEEAFL